MSEDLGTRLDLEFEACTPDIAVDSAGLVARGKRLRRSRLAVVGTAVLALVMALGVVIGNLPGDGDTPDPTWGPLPGQSSYPLPDGLSPDDTFFWVGQPRELREREPSSNPEVDRLNTALIGLMRDSGVNIGEYSRVWRGLEGLESRGKALELDEIARWDASLAKRVVYGGEVEHMEPSPGASGRLPHPLETYEFTAVPMGSFLPGPGPADAGASGDSRHLYACGDFREQVGDYIVGDWTNTCSTTDLPGGARLVTVESRRVGHGNEAPVGVNTVVLFLANGNAYTIVDSLRYIDDDTIRPPAVSAARLGEVLLSLPEVVIY